MEFFPFGDPDPPAKRAMQDLTREERVEVGHWLELLQELGPYKLLESKRVAKMAGTKEDLYELRIRRGRRQFRAFFCIRGHCLWILHFVEKKRQRILKHIRLAERRAKQIPH
jgi:phage-related protein